MARFAPAEGVKTIDGVPIEEVIVDDLPLNIVPSPEPKDWSNAVTVLSNKIVQLSLAGKTYTLTRLGKNKSHSP